MTTHEHMVTHFHIGAHPVWATVPGGDVEILSGLDRSVLGTGPDEAAAWQDAFERLFR